MAYTVTQNTSFLTAASVLQKVVSFFYFTLLARAVGVENVGQYFFALTFTTIFSVVADFGLANTLTREAAKFPEKSGTYATTVFWSKIIFGFFAYALVIAALQILKYPASLKLLIFLSGITMFFDNLQTVFYSLLRARKNLFYEAIGMVGSQVLTLAIGGTALYYHWPLYTLIIAYTVPSFCNLVYASLVVRRLQPAGLEHVFDSTIARSFLKLAWPIAVAGIVGRLYAYSDSLLMSKMVSSTELGLWSVPYKTTFAFQFIPVALAASLYPVISSLFLTEPNKIGDLITKAYRYLFTIIFPLAIGLGVLARPVIVAFYGIQYTPAIPVLQILLAGLVFIFLTLINGALFNAVGKQKTQTLLITMALVFNVLLNLVLLPRLGIRGAALAALASNLLLWLVGFIAIVKIISFPLSDLARFFNQTFWPAVGMGGLVWFLEPRIHWLFTIPVAVVCYGALLFISGGISTAMLQEFRFKLRSK